MKKIRPLHSGRVLLYLTALLCTAAKIHSQDVEKVRELPAKVSHAEPLYLDLVRDLGARKGEKEINIGADYRRNSNYYTEAFLVEYEFAPVHRLGLEIEADFSFFRNRGNASEVPGNKLEALRFSSQYSFWVSEKHRATLALGYAQILELTDFRKYGKENLIAGTAYNPFFIAAKRWGRHIHSLWYTGPVIRTVFKEHTVTLWQINTSFHYTMGKGHFAGIEINQEVNAGKVFTTLRPQVKVRLSSSMAIGYVAGFPITHPGEGFSSFLRLICEL
ncbi:hypothetical protein SAMN02927921_02033 [Sinomicrobium oceani]|uniref:MetA-pathway of phenol degradation n=1 Tax=Sinomicrobium oceani TaxID=1150368 RepID=A0A1K1PUH9_9FLAO|nr:HAEPLYID family protein [Sinomicrobium oceani]SFW51312.1 hypothetical protein SAMN02927921_02033 [Sinomicrobium oceani]